MRDGRIDCVFCDVSFHAEVVVARGIGCECAALYFHLMGGLPGSTDHFADTTHRLGVGGNHRECAQVMKYVLGGDGLTPDA